MDAKDLNEPIFPDATKTENKDDLIGKEVKIKAFRPMGEDDDKYYIVLAEVDGKDVTFSSGSAINTLIEKASQKVGTDQKKDDYYLKETINGTFVKTKTKDGKRSYYNVE